jgi:hypothetical protein
MGGGEALRASAILVTMLASFTVFYFVALIDAMQEITRRVNATVGFWLVVLIYVILGLLEVDRLAWKLGRMSNRHAAHILPEGSVAAPPHLPPAA